MVSGKHVKRFPEMDKLSSLTSKPTEYRKIVKLESTVKSWKAF